MQENPTPQVATAKGGNESLSLNKEEEKKKRNNHQQGAVCGLESRQVSSYSVNSLLNTITSTERKKTYSVNENNVLNRYAHHAV